MAAKTDKLTQELKKNYSVVQSKDIEIKDIKSKSDKTYNQSIKTFNSELTKSMTELKKKSSETKVKFDEELKVLKAANKLESDELINASKKIVRSNNTKTKKIDKDFETNLKATEDKLISLKTTYEASLVEVESKHSDELKASNTRKDEGLSLNEANLSKVNQKIEASIQIHQTNLDELNDTSKKELDETKGLYIEKISSAEDDLKTLSNDNFVAHQELKNAQKQIFDNLLEKIEEEVETFNSKMEALDVSINSRIERYEKFMKKREEENDAKGVKEQLREIKKTNTEREKQLKLLNKKHLTDSKKLENEKTALIKSQILELSNLDKQNCKKIEEETNKIELLKLESDKKVFDIEITFKKAIDKEKIRHNKEIRVLEVEKAKYIKEKALIIANETYAVSESTELFNESKLILLEVYNKEAAENKYKIEELKNTHDYEMEKARIENEMAISEHEVNEENIINKHKKDELTITENKIISEHSVVFSEQFAKSLEYVKYQNAFAIKNSEYTLKLEEYEELEANNRYTMKIEKLQNELDSIISSFEPLKEKINSNFEDEIRRYNDLIEHTTSDQRAALISFESLKKEEIAKIKVAKDLLPKKGNRKQIKALNKQISKMENDLESELKTMQEAIDKRVVLYTGEIAKAQQRKDKAIEQTNDYLESESKSYHSAIKLLEKNLKIELENINDRKANSIKEAKAFDSNARARRELTIDQNKDYQKVRSERHEDIINKLEDDYARFVKTNKDKLEKIINKLKNELEKKEENLEKTLKPLRNSLIDLITISEKKQEEVKKIAADNIEKAQKALQLELSNADKAEKEALETLESELAGREAILSFSKNEISNSVASFKKEYDNKVKLQNKLYKEGLSAELVKISNKLTTELSNLSQ